LGETNEIFVGFADDFVGTLRHITEKMKNFAKKTVEIKIMCERTMVSSTECKLLD